MAGCNSSTCFHTPALAKRAFSLAKVGDMKAAFTDIEKAIVLDTMNPDLYCVRYTTTNILSYKLEAHTFIFIFDNLKFKSRASTSRNLTIPSVNKITIHRKIVTLLKMIY